MPSVQLAFGHLIQCNINEIIQRTTTCLLFPSVAPGGHGKSMVPLPHGTVGVYLSLTLTFGIENSSHPFLTLISDHIPYVVYHVIHVNYGINRSPFKCSGIRITWGKTTSRTMDFFASAALSEPDSVLAFRPWPCTEFMLIIPTFVPVKISQDTYLRVLAVLAPCEPHRGFKLHGLNSDTLREKNPPLQLAYSLE